MRHLLLCLLILPLVGRAADWTDTLRERLPALGHRNWIVIADSAYPLQIAPGIETVVIDVEQTDAVQAILSALAKTRHVQPVIFTDAELPLVREQRAPGIGAYRTALARVLGDRPVQSLPHEQIIAKLDEAGKTFRVLLFKTHMTLPYTSVFIQLECGYWTPEAELELRATK